MSSAHLLCVVLPLTVQAREVVSFDFGWRTRLGFHVSPQPNTLWPLPNNTSPGLNPAEAQPDFDDSSWERVRLPHDGLVAEGPSNVTCPSGCSGRSYIPRAVMWYRKAFLLPDDWLLTRNQTSIWLEFDGIFRATIVYLNGDIIAQNTQGYLGFEVPLFKAVKGTNVLGVYKTRIHVFDTNLVCSLLLPLLRFPFFFCFYYLLKSYSELFGD